VRLVYLVSAFVVFGLASVASPDSELFKVDLGCPKNPA
jgi:hypothetical protein